MGCQLCPRACGAERGNTTGLCHTQNTLLVARAAPHKWEEPCISGTKGSGTVFFCGCPLGCSFCQNHAISRGGLGKELTVKQLAEAFLRLQGQGVHNLNLVTAGHFYPQVLKALHIAKQNGLRLPVAWNTSSYETANAIKALSGEVDIWLADLKFFSPALSTQLAGAPDYFEVASRAILDMQAQSGPPKLSADGLLQSGLIVRLLVLPGQREDAKQLLRWLARSLAPGSFYLSLMSQYTPPPGIALPRPFHRRVSSYEYNDVLDTALSLGLTQGFTQQRTSAAAEYTPPFDLTGLL